MMLHNSQLNALPREANSRMSLDPVNRAVSLALGYNSNLLIIRSIGIIVDLHSGKLA